VTVPFDPQKVWDFVSVDIPPGGTPMFKQWQEQVRTLGDRAPDVLLDALENGRENQQLVAVIALRYFGYESYAEGYGSKTVYKVRLPGAADLQTIIPLHLPRDMD
jgi:hypothetical protein